MLRLINNGPSPFGRKVMVILEEKSIPYEAEWDIPWHSDTIVAGYNPLEQLPILISDDGDVIYESSYILEWVDVMFPEPKLTPADAQHRLAMGRLRVLAVGVLDALVRTNFELARPEAQQSEQWILRHIRKINGGLGELDRLIAGSEYAVGNAFSLADIEVGCVLGQLDFIGANVPPLKDFFEIRVPWRKSNPGLADYTDHIERRPSFQASSPFMVDIDFASVVA